MAQVRLDGVEVPGELLELLERSRLKSRDKAGQIAAALAIHLFSVGEISAGRAAELLGETRADFDALLRELGVATTSYGDAEYAADQLAVDELAKRRKSA